MILYGASGHGKVIAEILLSNGQKQIHFWDDAPKPNIWHYPVIQPDEKTLEKLSTEELIVSIGNNKIRKNVAEANSAYFRFGKAIHPAAIISSSAFVAPGTVIMPAAVVNADARIGRHCIINTGAIVEHECLLEDYVHISPNASLCGNVRVGEGTHIGAGAVVIPGVRIGKWSVVGAGAVVVRDVPDHCTVVGNPAKIIKTLIPA